MTARRKRNVEELLRLADALVDDILTASDEEIVAEVKEQGEDVTQAAERTRALFENSAMIAAKGRLLEAKAAVAANRQRSAVILKLAPIEARERLRRIIANDPERQFTMATRKGEVLSDEDVRSLLEDLVELGLIDMGGDPKK